MRFITGDLFYFIVKLLSTRQLSGHTNSLPRYLMKKFKDLQIFGVFIVRRFHVMFWCFYCWLWLSAGYDHHINPTSQTCSNTKFLRIWISFRRGENMMIIHVLAFNLLYWQVRFQIRDHSQILFPIFIELEGINQLLFTLNSSENHRFFDDFKANRSYKVRLSSETIP